MQQTAEEVDILQRYIREFHNEAPHSKVRREIISKTVIELQNISENKQYWNVKRVRTWFWNHRTEVNLPEGVGETLTDFCIGEKSNYFYF